MRIAVIHEAPRVTEHSKEILMHIKNAGHEALYIRISSLNVDISTGEIRVSSRKGKVYLDGAFPRGLGSYVSAELFSKRISTFRALEYQGVRLVNNSYAIEKSKDKLVSLMLLSQAGVPVPETVVTEDPIEVMRIVERRGEVVIKPIMGSLGLGSVKVSDPDIGYRIAKTIVSFGSPVYVQEYVKKPDRDIRVVLVGDEILGGVYRINKTSWKTNVAQGAVTQVAQIDSQIKEIAFKAKEVLELDYAGIDLVESDRGYLLLEVNASPLWKGFKAATGIDVAERLVKYMLNALKR